MNKNTMKQFKESMEFLTNHPAFNGQSPLENSCIDCMEVCKNGYALGNYDEEFQTISKPSGSKIGPILKNRNDEVPYKDYFGYKWKFDRIDLWLECGAFTFEDAFDYHGTRYHDTNLDCGGRTVESAIITLAELVKKNYGEYDIKSVTPKWVEKHNIEQPDFFIDCGKNTMKSNPDCNYISISPADYNALWWKKNKKICKSFGVDISQFSYADKYKNKISYFLDREIEKEKFRTKQKLLRDIK